jgi:hypothetical protein
MWEDSLGWFWGNCQSRVGDETNRKDGADGTYGGSSVIVVVVVVGGDGWGGGLQIGAGIGVLRELATEVDVLRGQDGVLASATEGRTPRRCVPTMMEAEDGLFTDWDG